MRARWISAAALAAVLPLAGVLADATPAGAVPAAPLSPAAVVAPGTTQSFTESATLSTSGQNMFGPGATAGPNDLTDTFFDLNLPNSSVSGGGGSGFDFCSGVPFCAGSCPTDWGAQATASSSGEVGLSARTTLGRGAEG